MFNFSKPDQITKSGKYKKKMRISLNHNLQYMAACSIKKMENYFMTKYYAIVLVVFSVAAVSSSSSNNSIVDLSEILSEVKLLKMEVAELKYEREARQMDDTEVMNSSDAADIQTLKLKVAAIENVKATRNGICQIRHNPCGNTCICVEDYRLVSKYFCDCRSQVTRRDCKEHHVYGARINGLYTINANVFTRVIQVFCDQTTDGGGWTVIQRRMDGSENFYRNWVAYKLGFGQLHREHWIGNENIFRLTTQAFLKGSEVSHWKSVESFAFETCLKLIFNFFFFFLRRNYYLLNL